MKFENTIVMNFDGAIRGMRNPLESWKMSDSVFGISEIGEEDSLNEVAELYNNYNKELAITFNEDYTPYDFLGEQGITKIDENYYEFMFIGPNDLSLMQRLIKAGSTHRKFMRQIFVSVDITAPLYYWKEADTYKVGTVSNSTSTMHKLATTPITIDCFETDDMVSLAEVDNEHTSAELKKSWCIGDDSDNYPLEFIDYLEDLRIKYFETKDKRYWKALIRWLPESWLQKRTMTFSYENIYSMIRDRKTHKLNEWSGLDDASKEYFIKWAKTLPYADVLLFFDLKD